jgi:hypothetical protein
LVEEEKETLQFQQNAATLYQISCVLILGPDRGSGKESRPIQANLPQVFYETIVKCTNLGTWLPGRFDRGKEGNIEVPAEHLVY